MPRSVVMNTLYRPSVFSQTMLHWFQPVETILFASGVSPRRKFFLIHFNTWMHS